MTQKEKLARAAMMAIQIKNVASSLRDDARVFDCHFPIAQAERLEQIANDYLRAR